MYDDRTASQTKKIPCSDNIVQRKTVEMAVDVSDQFLGRAGKAIHFSVVFVPVPGEEEVLGHI
jgi:hypothetical protein